MTTSTVDQADADARLIVESFGISAATGDPTVWNNYVSNWAANVNRRIIRKFADEPDSGNPVGAPGTGSSAPAS